MMITIIILLALCVKFSHQTGLNYSELDALHASCAPDNTCELCYSCTEGMATSCDCDSSCVKHDSCCIDSPYLDDSIRRGREGIPRETCVTPLASSVSIYMQSKCHRTDIGSSLIKSKCEGEEIRLSDPLGLAPVTNTVTNTTYKNYFCALCNNDTANLSFWKARVSLDMLRSDEEITENDIDQNLSFDETTWYVSITRGNETTPEVIPIIINYEVPQELTNRVSHCTPNLVSKCDSTWTNKEVEEKCLIYMGVVYAYESNTALQETTSAYNDTTGQPVISYRNVHCAICNNKSNFMCTAPELTIVAATSKPGMSFTLLIDVNRSGGEKVGENNPCGPNGLYDRFFKKCRSMICVEPGYLLKGKRCVPPE